VAFRSPVFPLQLKPGRNVFYLRVRTQGSSILALYLWDRKGFEDHRFHDTLTLGLMFGIIAALFFYNAFLALSFNSRTYTHYSLFLLVMIGTQLSLQGLWPYFVEEKLGIWLTNHGFLFLAALANICATLVTISFLDVKQLMRRTHVSLQIVLISACTVFAYCFFATYSQFAKVNSLFLGIHSLTLLVIAVIAAARGFRPALYYTIAWVFFLGANILNTLHFEGIYHSPLTVQFSNFVGSVIEGLLMSFALASRVNYMRDQADQTIRGLNSELQHQITHVEAIVAERTETIRNILDHVRSGFVMIDREGIILSGFSRSCTTLLGTAMDVGQKLSELLHMSDEEERVFSLALDQIFQDTLPLEVTLAQLPINAKVKQRTLKLEYGAVRKGDGLITNLLITIQDATELHKRQREARRNRVLLTILRDLEAFRQFIGSSFNTIRQLKSNGNKRDVAFLLHTLKGNCLVYKMRPIVDFIHQLEAQSILAQEGPSKLSALFEGFLDTHRSFLRTDWGPYTSEIRISSSQLQTLRQLGNQLPFALRDELEKWIDMAIARPCSQVVQPLMDSCRITGKRQGKDINFEIKGGSVRLLNRGEERVAELLIHILRNAVVHGIESDRVSAGKPKQGHIQLEFQADSEALSIICTDDGQGFDRLQWEQAAVDKGLLPPGEAQNKPLGQLVSLVARGGYSTAAEVSLVAGRGVGLEGFFQAIEQCKGSIRIISEKGCGSQFIIVLPRGAAGQQKLAS
ncbi:MAG: ATP-binding protein, partial [Pseudobdellovibrionaceae bacterium]|nr:ATP-binding protein [Pseudobdellovibrionaceae bacterium]